MYPSLLNFVEATSAPATPMPFAAIRDLAGSHAKRLERLVGLMVPPCEESPEDVAGLARELVGIELVLSLLGATPNAYLNREALDALQERVTRAGCVLSREWAEELSCGLREAS